MTESFSLDLLPVDGAVVSGFNFREVAPEVLSPLSWSVVGAGMERGFRTIAARLQTPVPQRSPAFVAYAAFRPYHVISQVQALHPLIPWADLWALFLGGDPPGGVAADHVRVSAGRLVDGARGLARVWVETDDELDALHAEVAAVEHRVRRAGHGNVLALGRLVDDAVSVGRRAWAAHVLATGRALASASILRRALEVRDDRESVDEILRIVAHRLDAASEPSSRPGRLPGSLATITSYELAAGTDRFARWERVADVAAARHQASTAAEGSHPVLLGRTVVGRAAVFLSSALDRALQGRERSKAIGLRSLHALRTVLSCGAVGHELADVVLLGAEELLGCGEADRRDLIAARAREVDLAARLDLPVDARVRGTRLVPLARRSAPAGGGVPLAPGWAQGRLVPVEAAEPGAVVYGRAVEGNVVIATRPAAVVVEMGSTLSHVAIVCRELQIPLVAGVRLRPEDAGRHAVVDGWSGEVALHRQEP